MFDQFYGEDHELVSGKNIDADTWISENRKVWLIVDRATNEERTKWMENFHKYKKMYDTFPVVSLMVDGLPSDFPEEYAKINKMKELDGSKIKS
jgi:hypothetical protein